MRRLGCAWLVGCSFVLVVASMASAQNVQNPSLLNFTSVDAMLVDRHEMEVVRLTDSVTIQTLTHQGPYTSTAVSVPLNVQPVGFGTYTIKTRACAGTICSDWSEPSNAWDRIPGRPTKPVAQ